MNTPKTLTITVSNAAKVADDHCKFCQEEIAKARTERRKLMFRADVDSSSKWHVFATRAEAVKLVKLCNS